MPMLKLEISSEIKRPVEEVFAYLTDPVNRRELIDERSYDTAILLALGGGSLLGRRHRWFRRAIHLLRPLESEKCRLDEDGAAQRCVNPDEFRPHPCGRVCDLVGIRRGRAASTLAPLSRTDNIPSRAGSHSVGLSHVRAFLFP